jgi:hypothetical protein
VTEAELQASVLELAEYLGWLRAHFRPAMTKHGWRTPVAGDGKGFPDLVLLRERLVVAELKGDRGSVRPEQRRWLEAFARAGIEVYVWTPSEWQDGVIECVLRATDRPELPVNPAQPATRDDVSV